MQCISPFIRRVAQLLPAQGRSLPLLEGLGFRTSCFEKGEDIIAIGSSVRQVVAIGQGVAMRYRLLPDGSRQVIMFLTPGDICNPHIYPTVIDHGVAAVTSVRIDRFECENFINLTTTVVGLNQALCTLAEEQNALMRDRITSLGRADARLRVVTLLREMMTRLAGPASSGGPVFIPVTQTLLADAIGVTNIHFNRVVGDLVRRGVVSTSRGGILVHSIDKIDECLEEIIEAA